MLTCPACGQTNPATAQRCEACDGVLRGVGRALATVDSMNQLTVQDLPDADAVRAAVAEVDGASRTVFGLPSPVAGTPEPGEQRTVRDLPSRDAVLAALDPSREAVAEPSPDLAKTAFGMPSLLASPDVTPAADAEPDVPPASAKTVFGLPAPRLEVPAQPTPAVTPEPAGTSKTLYGAPVPAATPAMGSPPASEPPAPRTPKLTPAAPTPAVKPRRDVGSVERERERAELYAATKFAAALAEDERRLSKARQRRALLALLVVAVLAAAVGALALREEAALKASLVGEPKVARADGRFDVEVSVRTSEPAIVTHPGGEARGEGDWLVSFSVPEADMSVGANTIALQARAEGGGEPVRLPVNIVLYYRFSVPATPPPKAGVPVKAYVEVDGGWKVAVEGGEVHPAGERRFELALDPAPVLVSDGSGELPVRLTLSSPDGRERQFAELVRVPVPEAPLQIWNPAHGWRRTAGAVAVRGRTLPGARVGVGKAQSTVGEDGVFELEVPVKRGRNRIDLSVRAPGRRSISRSVSVERLSPGEQRKERKALQKLAKGFMKGAPKTPDYGVLLAQADALAGQKVRVRGRVVEVRRGADDGDEIQVATCSDAGGCPVWVHLQGPLLAGQGDGVTVVGKLAGKHVFHRGGAEVEAPRVEASILLP